MKPRRPSVTSLCVHASGELFVTGHIDGSLAFWAVGDEDRPLMIRTIHKIDIDYPVGEELDLILSNPQPPSEEEVVRHQLEPIFKLAWSSFGPQSLSDPYSSDTILNILGGSVRGQETGITTIRLPPIVLSSPTPGDTSRVQPETRRILSKCFSSMDIYTYRTIGTAIDFLQVPRENAHFGGNLDPRAILILFEWPEGQRTVDVREYPPPDFGIGVSVETPVPAPSPRIQSNNPLDTDLPLALDSIRLNEPPRDYTHSLPPAFWTGLYGVCDGDVVRLESEEYNLLRKAYQPSISNIFTQLGRDKVAGVAWVNYPDHDQAQDVLFTKGQAHRLLVTHHRDLTIRFQDISPQLLIGSVSSPLPSSFPAPLPHLTISLARLLTEPCITEARRPLTVNEAEVQSVQLTTESNECLIIMRSGHVFVFGFDGRQRHTSRFVDLYDGLIRLVHVASAPHTFQPLVMVENAWGRVTAAKMSDIGEQRRTRGEGGGYIPCTDKHLT